MGLVTLAIAKGELDIPDSDTTQDDRVNKAIDAASAFVEGYCDRKFATNTYTHYFDGNDSRYLLLRQFPVTAITDAWVDDEWVFDNTKKLAASGYKVHQDVMLTRKCGKFQYTNALAVKVIYVAGYATIPLDVQQAVLEMMKFIYFVRNDRRTGLAAKTKLGENVAFETNVPPIVAALLASHVRAKYLSDQLSIFPPEMVKRLSEGGNGQG